MRFAREGFAIVAGAFVLALAAGLLFGTLAFAAGVALALAALSFFRDPERTPPADEALVVSPADGRVVVATAGETGHRLSPESTVRVAIFMSPLDVHVNRAPLAASVEKVEHRRGRFAAAYRADAAEINENNALLLRTGGGLAVVVVQIAGWLARRIVCRVAPPAWLGRGERFGLIMFGSRVDVYLPPGATLLVSEGDRVRAGETPLARLAEGVKEP